MIKKAEELKEIYDHYVDKKDEVMKSTHSQVDDLFVVVGSKDTISPEQIIKPNIFPIKNFVNLNVKFNFKLLKP